MLAWTVTTDGLKRSFTNEDFEIDHSFTPEAQELQRDLARHWNGPVERPAWWFPWKRQKSSLMTYQFRRPGQPPAGMLSFATKRRERHGMNLVVHDFWAATRNTAAAMLAFLGSHSTRAETIEFRRGVLPPYPSLLHNLHHHRVTAEAWHPWMLRILDLREAVRLRGWPADLDATVPLGIENERDSTYDRYVLRITAGSGEISTTNTESKVMLTRQQFAVWYAGGYRTAASARLAGVHAVSEKVLTTLVRSTADLEPWLPDHF